MATIKQQLVKLIQKFGENHRHHLISVTADELADKLIEAGFVKTEEPKEFWIYTPVGSTEKKITEADPKTWPPQSLAVMDIVHVREVVEE